jgi:hypothetical protein
MPDILADLIMFALCFGACFIQDLVAWWLVLYFAVTTV